MLLLTINLTVILPIAGLIVGLAIGYFITATLLKKAVTKEADAYLEEAKEKAEVIKKERILQAKEKFLQMKDEHEKACNERKRELQKTENKVNQMQQQASQKLEEVQRKSKEIQSMQDKLTAQQDAVAKRKAELDQVYEEESKKLEAISGLSVKDAKDQLIELIKDDAKAEAMVYVKEITEDAKMTAQQEAKKVVLETIQRTAAETAIENTVSLHPNITILYQSVFESPTDCISRSHNFLVSALIIRIAFHQFPSQFEGKFKPLNQSIRFKIIQLPNFRNIDYFCQSA